jgi:solute:Na+ symporter, SSS family
LLAAVLVAFVALMFGIAVWARGRIATVEDYLVAGRRLSWPLATATLFATWFGAGTLMTATDEVRAEGLRAAALEPIGPGLCLVIAGLFFASRLWRMKLTTLPDFYRRRFGPRAEVVSSLIMIPGYFGWIAAQFVALAGILDVFWHIPMHHGIWLVAAVGTGYTLLGGMWSVTLTDAAQLVLLLAGIVVLAVTVLVELAGPGNGLGAGLAAFADTVPAEDLVLIPKETAAALVAWLSVLAIGALGNIPGQDLAQRIFAARSARVAASACLAAGVLYIVFGMVPVATGLAADSLGVGGGQATLAVLATALMSPAVGIVFVLAIVSAVMSTIDSAILAPSSVLSQNLLAKLRPDASRIALARGSVAAVAACSVAFAYVGQSAYELLETAYAVGMVGLFVPLAVGLASARGSEGAAIAAMCAGILLWGLHVTIGWDDFGGPLLGAFRLPQELVATAAAWLTYEVVAASQRDAYPNAGRAASPVTE